MSYKKVKNRLIFGCAVALCAGLLFTGCSSVTSSITSSVSAEESDEDSDAASSVDGSTIDVSDQFTERDLEQTYDESSAIQVELADGSSTSSDDSVQIDGDVITISEEGVYVLSGTLSNGQIVVNNEDKDAKIQIVLNGVNIVNQSSACIYVKAADKVFVTTAEGTDNNLTVTGKYVVVDENNVDAVIFSKDDLVLNGQGSLNIEAVYGHGVVSKDDLKVTGGTLTIDAAEHGLSGKDSVRITNAVIDITANEDGIHSGNGDDESETAGYIYVEDGTITVKAGDDGMHADLETRVDGGEIKISDSYEGLEGQIVTITGGDIDVTSSDDGVNAGGGADSSGITSAFGGGRDGFSASNTDCKIYIYGGTLKVNSSGDGIDSNGDIYIYGGDIYVDGPENDGNAAIDKGDQSQAYIYGGTIVATSMSGMAEAFSDSSSQVSILINLTENATGEVVLKNSDGTTLLSYTPSKSYNSVTVSTSDLQEGETYTIVTGETSTEITVDGISVTEGEAGAFGGDMRGNRGQMDGQPPERGNFNGQMPNGEAPGNPEASGNPEENGTGTTESDNN